MPYCNHVVDIKSFRFPFSLHVVTLPMLKKDYNKILLPNSFFIYPSLSFLGNRHHDMVEWTRHTKNHKITPIVSFLGAQHYMDINNDFLDTTLVLCIGD